MNRLLVSIACCIVPAYCQSNGYSIATAAGGQNAYYYSGTGDGGAATNAALGTPAYDVTVDGAGNLYVIAGGLVRKVTPDGRISTVAGGGLSVGEFVPATQAALSPTAIVADAAGDLYIADTAFGNARIRMVDTKGIITTFAGGAPCCDLGDGGMATDAYIGTPYGLALDSSGALYIAQSDRLNNVIRKVQYNYIGTVAGGGAANSDGVPATSVALSRPVGVAVDGAGNLYIAEATGNRIRKVTTDGNIATIAGGVNSPQHVAVGAGGYVFITQINDGQVRMVAPNGTLSTIASSLDRPAGISLGNCSQVYVTESSYTIPTVRVLNPTPAILTGGVVPSGSSATTIEPDSWVSIYGSNLAGCTGFWNGDFPTSLGGTTVTINSKPGYLWFVSPTQINVQAPDDMTTGPVSVVVTTAGGKASSTVNLGQYAPAFSLISSMYPAAIVSTATGFDNIGPSGAFPYATRPVKVGETVTLFGGGFGPTNPPVAAGKVVAGAAPCVTLPQVTIGGMPATVSFAGIVGAGLYQLNVVVPNVGSGDQPLEASVSGATTQSNIFLTIQ